MPVNANLLRNLALTGVTTLLLAGCTSTVSRRPHPAPNQPRVVSHAPMGEPNFSSQPKPMAISESHPTQSSPKSLTESCYMRPSGAFFYALRKSQSHAMWRYSLSR